MEAAPTGLGTIKPDGETVTSTLPPAYRPEGAAAPPTQSQHALITEI